MLKIRHEIGQCTAEEMKLFFQKYPREKKLDSAIVEDLKRYIFLLNAKKRQARYRSRLKKGEQ